MTDEPPATDLLDVNVLVALAWEQHVHHDRCHRWFDERGDSSWATAPVTESGFVRVSMHPPAVGRTVTGAEVTELLRSLRAVPGHRFICDRSTLAAPLIDLERLVSRRQVTDLHLVNLAAQNGGRLATLDRAIPEYLVPRDRSFVHVLG